MIGGSRDRKTVGCYLPANRNIMFDIVDDPVLCVLRKATLSEGPAAQSGNVNVYNEYISFLLVHVDGPDVGRSVGSSRDPGIKGLFTFSATLAIGGCGG